MQVLGIGNMDHDEFSVVADDLQTQTEFHRVPDITAAISFLSRQDSGKPAGESTWKSVDPAVVRLIVLFQVRNGEYPQSAVEHLRRCDPLAPIVNVLGSLCEGEIRTGVPLHGCVRIYWHQWELQGRRQLDFLRNNRPSHWTLPATTTEDERILYDLRAANSVRGASHRVRGSRFRKTCSQDGTVPTTIYLVESPDCQKVDRGVRQLLFDMVQNKWQAEPRPFRQNHRLNPCLNNVNDRECVNLHGSDMEFGFPRIMDKTPVFLWYISEVSDKILHVVHQLHTVYPMSRIVLCMMTVRFDEKQRLLLAGASHVWTFPF